MLNQGAKPRIPGERRRVAALLADLDVERERRKAAETSAAGRRFEWVKQLSTAVTMATALGALIFTGLSLQQSRAQNDINEQGQITSRYTAAVDQLGSQNEDVRLGGIFALERIMHDSPPDQITVIQVLSAFIRNHPPGVSSPGTPILPRPKLPTDIESALLVLTSRPRPADDTPDLEGVSFRGLDLHLEIFSGLDLTGADFTGANLEDAMMDNTDLKTATFSDAGLEPADLTSVDLTNANLPAANMANVNLSYANLSDARLFDTNLTGANLTKAEFQGTALCDATKPTDSGRDYECVTVP